MIKNYLILVGVLGALAVVLGAFGAHTLSSMITVKSLSAYQTGIQYHFYHTLAILGIITFLGKLEQSKFLERAILSFVIGIVLFSGSLYLLACSQILAIESWKKIIGPITPIGGLAFIVGWSLVIYAGITETKFKNE